MPCRQECAQCAVPTRREDELDKVTRILCTLMKRMKRHYPDQVFGYLKAVPELADWWKEHQREDAAREAREKAAAEEQAAKKKAYYDLPPHVRKLLGVRDPSK